MLETRRVRLRDIDPDDLSTIYSWRNTKNFRYYVRSNDDLVTFPEFCVEFKHYSEIRPYQYIIETIESKFPIGLTYIHSVSDSGTRAFLNIFITDDYVGLGYGVDVFLLICRHIFTKTSVEEICAQAFSYNEFSLSALKGANIPSVETDEKRVHKGKTYPVFRFCVGSEHMNRVSKLIDALCRKKRSQK